MNEISLFDYQREMLSRIGRAFMTHQSVMVQMPTGTGKTYLLAAVVGSEAHRVASPCVWIVAHRRELVAQIKETLERFSATMAEHCLVMSIQWLSRHYRDMKEQPSLIVIDEAHHALAETYAAVMNAYPKAKKLGLTATPYRLNGRGFTDLFDVLLTSWSVERFIAEGRLSLYDYYSIRPCSEDQRLIDSLKLRGADGDYRLSELSEVVDVRPSLERLLSAVRQYVPNRKGIVYAISIAHAEHIAEFYRENGVNAVAISSKTPASLRKQLLERFKRYSFSYVKTKTSLGVLPAIVIGERDTFSPIQVLVSVDLFSEGFDCPDVEFIQLARPTLSLAKYLQMVGRGLRVADGKRYCVILDNVGLYRRFGLPSADRDWQRMFRGRTELDDHLQEACLRINRHQCCLESIANDTGGMMKILGHEYQCQMISDGGRCEIVADGGGWVDQRNGLRFAKRPQVVRLLGVEFCTADGMKFYPRIRSKFIDDNAYANLKTLELQVGYGIRWKGRLIPIDNPHKVYRLCEKLGSVRLYVDDDGKYYAQGNPDLCLTPVSSQDAMNEYCQEYNRREKAALQKQAMLRPHRRYADSVLQRRGFVRLLSDGDWLYVQNIPDLADKPLRNWQVVADDNICVVNNEFLFLKQEPRLWFKILKHTDDFSYFVVKEYNNNSGYANPSDIIITQSADEGLKLYSNGVAYKPYFQVAGSSKILQEFS